jgi:RES domain
MTEAPIEASPFCVSPGRTHRLIPTRFPPVQTFDSVTTVGDLEAVLELEGWTDDRLVAHRLNRLPPETWVYGVPNASIVMAAFLHGSPDGLRFTSPDLGAWYASSAVETGLVEVLNGLRRELSLTQLDEKTEEYREYTSLLRGDFVDIRGGCPNLHDPNSYAASQSFGERVRASDRSGIAYDSVRDPGGSNWVCYRPRNIGDVVQGRHYRARVPRTGKVIVELLRTDAER